MGAPIKTTQMGRMWDAHCASIMMALKGTPLLDREGNPILHNGELIMLPPSAAHLREARELMKQCGIDEEPVEGSKIVEVAKAARQFEDDQSDPFEIEHQKYLTVQ